MSAEWEKIRPWGRVARITAADGVFWAKANRGDTRYEAPLVRLLGTLVPAHVVVPLAIDAERGWTLSPDGGSTLRATRAGSFDRAAWERMLAEYAELQRSLEAHVPDLLAAGTPDQRPERVPEHLSALLADAGIRAALGAELAAVEETLPTVTAVCDELAASGVRSTLQHDDLHDHNVLVRDGRYAFFDWGDSSVAYPFATLLVALRVAAAAATVEAGDPLLERLRDAYLEPWTAEFDRADLVRWARLAVTVTPVSRSLSYRRALVEADAAGLAEWGEGIHGWLTVLTEPPVF
ncbi:MAG: phosphotransferase [Streptomycetaceae bacterium]|nr:phosphotransferase [Streptomycetaceae bacterium]